MTFRLPARPHPRSSEEYFWPAREAMFHAAAQSRRLISFEKGFCHDPGYRRYRCGFGKEKESVLTSDNPVLLLTSIHV
jgi:hypothetical protein